MLTNYYTLRSLVAEWREALLGAEISDVWSQDRGEISIAFDSIGDGEDNQSHALKISVQFPLRFAYLNPSTARARRNVVSLFPDIIGERIVDASIVENDRLLALRLDSGRIIRFEIFGPNANIYLLDETNCVKDRFLQKGTAVGDPVAAVDAVILPLALEEISAALRSTEGPLRKRFAKAVPVFQGVLALEVLKRAQLDPDSTAIPDDMGLQVLHKAFHAVLEDLESPEPTVYWEEDRAQLFSVISIAGNPLFTAESFESVNEAVRVFARAKLRHRAFDQKRDPLVRLLSSRLSKSIRSRDVMKVELARKSRADTYERYGHLLMALQHEVLPKAEAVTVADIISGTNQEITIPLRPELSGIKNAERYYERARETRKAHEQSRVRLKSMDVFIAQLEVVLSGLDKTTTASEIERYRKKNADFLSTLSSQGVGFENSNPFRCYILANGYEVWVGRNAAQNDRLTMKEARKYDLWMHARGVSGSHAILRVPRRNERPPRHVVETAASIAAYHSKARTSELAPVIVVERRYVRKPRKSPPGTVFVEREEVLIVRPELPVQA